MFYHRRSFEEFQFRVATRLSVLAAIAVGIVLSPSFTAAQQSGQRTFSSAADASQALVAALESNERPDLLSILGPDAKDILSSGDASQDQNDRSEFVQKYRQMHRLVDEPDGTTALYIGAENWPTPIPLAHKGDAWYFDTSAGKREILYRRVGRNELTVIQVCRELVDAEKEYYSRPHDGDSANEYARRFLSDPGKHNGLYWQADSEGESPVGPLVASAAAESDRLNQSQDPQPFQGYYFRILTAQGAHGPGGARSYIADGKMIRGFAFLAYPAEYRSSGVMTFIVDQDGIVYEKDLGRRTFEIVKTISRYNRDATWHKTE